MIVAGHFSECSAIFCQMVGDIFRNAREKSKLFSRANFSVVRTSHFVLRDYFSKYSAVFPKIVGRKVRYDRKSLYLYSQKLLAMEVNPITFVLR